MKKYTPAIVGFVLLAVGIAILLFADKIFVKPEPIQDNPPPVVQPEKPKPKPRPHIFQPRPKPEPDKKKDDLKPPEPPPDISKQGQSCEQSAAKEPYAKQYTPWIPVPELPKPDVEQKVDQPSAAADQQQDQDTRTIIRRRLRRF